MMKSITIDLLEMACFDRISAGRLLQYKTLQQMRKYDIVERQIVALRKSVGLPAASALAALSQEPWVAIDYWGGGEAVLEERYISVLRHGHHHDDNDKILRRKLFAFCQTGNAHVIALLRIQKNRSKQPAAADNCNVSCENV